MGRISPKIPDQDQYVWERHDHYKQLYSPKQTISLVYVEQQLGQVGCSSSAGVLQMQRIGTECQ